MSEIHDSRVTKDNVVTQPDADLWRLCVAPMIDVTDRHCRFFHRQLAPHARLYTEMVSTGALLHGDARRHLDFDPAEHPVALQLGGNEPDALAQCARMAQTWGYDEVNLNCGCPSPRVQRGAFGACLMAEPALVADCLKAMQDAVSIPITVKHRLGLDYNDDYGFVRDFVGKLHQDGVRVFIVHARNAVLQGLSPRENRQIPPLRYDVATQLKRDFPNAIFVLNGGVAHTGQAVDLLTEFDGVMLGRAAWHTPTILSDIHRIVWPDQELMPADDVIAAMADYAQAQIQQGTPLRFVTRAMLGWASGRKGARYWRRTLSDAVALNQNDPELIRRAWADLGASVTIA